MWCTLHPTLSISSAARPGILQLDPILGKDNTVYLFDLIPGAANQRQSVGGRDEDHQDSYVHPDDIEHDAGCPTPIRRFGLPRPGY